MVSVRDPDPRKDVSIRNKKSVAIGNNILMEIEKDKNSELLILES